MSSFIPNIIQRNAAITQSTANPVSDATFPDGPAIQNEHQPTANDAIFTNFAADETPTSRKNLASTDPEERIVNSTPQSLSNDPANSSVADISRETAPASSVPGSEPSLLEEFKCDWVGCLNRPAFTEAKGLYDHLIADHCEFPAGSPPLLCWWRDCEYFAPSGRHMRSHVHTHVAYYPHNCQYCGVAKKRMTDLRKHEKSCLDAARKYREMLDRQRE